jgi:Ethanolamine utilization protein EutJ (predicted chaperonin)
MFQFGNLANPRFIKGECSVKIERRAKRKKMQKWGRKMTLSSAASPPGFRPQTLDPECQCIEKVNHKSERIIKAAKETLKQ